MGRHFPTATPNYDRLAAQGLLPHTTRRSALTAKGWPAAEPTASAYTGGTGARPRQATWNAATARAFHAAAVALATACGLEARTNGCIAQLVEVVAGADGKPKDVQKAVSYAHLTEPGAILKSLRDTAIAAGLLPRATVAQHQQLQRLYNNAEFSRDEKQAAMLRLPKLYADEAVAWAAEVAQELERRRAGAATYAVVGEAYRVAA